MQPTPCPYALGENLNIEPKLYSWITEKHKQLSDKYGVGIVNLHTSRYPFILEMVSEPSGRRRINQLLKNVRKTEVIPPVDRLKSPVYNLTQSGQLALLMLIGIDRQVAVSEEHRIPPEDPNRMTPKEFINLVEKARDAWGSSCIARYYNTPTDVVSGTISPMSKASGINVPVIYNPPEITNSPSPTPNISETSNTNVPPVKANPPETIQPRQLFMRGVNIHSFKGSTTQDLAKIPLSELLQQVAHQSEMSAPTDSSYLPPQIILFLEFFGNTIQTNLMSKPEENRATLKFYELDNDITTLECTNLAQQLMNAYQAYRTVHPKAEPNPSLDQLLRLLARARSQKGLPI